MGNVHMEASQINYRGGEKKMSVEEALKNTSGEAAAIAQLQQDVSDLNDVKANKITIAPAFSAEASYDPGDLVYYNGLTYRCVNAHSGEWDADDFAATTIDGELAELRSGLNEVNSKLIMTSGVLTKADNNISEVENATWTQRGVVCQIYLRFTVNATISDDNAVLFRDVPYGVYCRFSLFNITGTKRLRLAIIRGEIQNAWTPGGITAGDYEGMFTYIINS